MERENIKLPELWTKIKFEDIITYSIGGDWGKSESYDGDNYKKVYCIRGSEFKNWKADKGKTAAIRKVKESSLQKRKLKKGDILVEISGGGPEQPVGRTVLIDENVLKFEPEIPKIFTNFLRLARINRNVFPYYLQYYFQFFYKSGSIVPYQGGSNNLRNLKFKDFITISIPLPPLPEQHEIVRRIEAMFSELDHAIKNLKKAREQLQTYRQAVLKHAFEGKLTEKWREQQTNLEPAEKLLEKIKTERQRRYEEQLKEWEAEGKAKKIPQKPNELTQLSYKELEKLPQLPALWQYTYLSNLGNLGRGKSKHRPRNDKILFGGEYPFIQTAEVKAADKYIETYHNTYNEFGLKQSKLWPKNTLCITIAANIAETAILNIDACFPDSIVGFTPMDPYCSLKYVYYFINSVQQDIETFAPATAQKNINLKILENLVIPYCSIEEQYEIVNQIEQRFSVADNLEKSIESSLTKAEALRQSILKKAFEGKLTKEWRQKHPELVTGENSTERLLERIKEEKEKVTGN